jgi:hypothetical protein
MKTMTEVIGPTGTTETAGSTGATGTTTPTVATVTSVLTNTWMNNPTYLAQMAHFLGAYAIIFTTFHFAGLQKALLATLAGALIAAIKEFWYDANYELPKQTSFDNILDFTMYVIGGGVALAVGYIATRVNL